MNAKYNDIYRYFFGCLSILIPAFFTALSFYDFKQEFIIKSAFLSFSFKFDPLSVFFVIFISSISIFISIFSIKYGEKYDKKPSLFFYSFFFIISIKPLGINRTVSTMSIPNAA